jgi:transposase
MKVIEGPDRATHETKSRVPGPGRGWAAGATEKARWTLRGVGPDFAEVLWSEGLYRHFDNRRQLASYAGLSPSPWQSGSISNEQGISKAGNPRLRSIMVQLSCSGCCISRTRRCRAGFTIA